MEDEGQRQRVMFRLMGLTSAASPVTPAPSPQTRLPLVRPRFTLAPAVSPDPADPCLLTAPHLPKQHPCRCVQAPTPPRHLVHGYFAKHRQRGGGGAGGRSIDPAVTSGGGCRHRRPQPAARPSPLTWPPEPSRPHRYKNS